MKRREYCYGKRPWQTSVERFERRDPECRIGARRLLSHTARQGGTVPTRWTRLDSRMALAEDGKRRCSWN